MFLAIHSSSVFLTSTYHSQFEVPGSALLDNLERDTTLLLPVAAPIKAGAPVSLGAVHPPTLVL